MYGTENLNMHPLFRLPLTEFLTSSFFLTSSSLWTYRPSERSSLVSGSPGLCWGCPSVSVSISPRLGCCRLIQWVCRLMTVSLFPCLKESLLLKVDDYYCCNVRKKLSLCWKSIAIWYKWHLFFLWKRDALECVCTQPLRMASWSINLTLSSVTSNVTGQLQGDWSLLSHSVSCSIGETAPFPLSSSV